MKVVMKAGRKKSASKEKLAGKKLRIAQQQGDVIQKDGTGNDFGVDLESAEGKEAQTAGKQKPNEEKDHKGRAMGKNAAGYGASADNLKNSTADGRAAQMTSKAGLDTHAAGQKKRKYEGEASSSASNEPTAASEDSPAVKKLKENAPPPRTTSKKKGATSASSASSTKPTIDANQPLGKFITAFADYKAGGVTRNEVYDFVENNFTAWAGRDRKTIVKAAGSEMCRLRQREILHEGSDGKWTVK